MTPLERLTQAPLGMPLTGPSGREHRHEEVAVANSRLGHALNPTTGALLWRIEGNANHAAIYGFDGGEVDKFVAAGRLAIPREHELRIIRHLSNIGHARRKFNVKIGDFGVHTTLHAGMAKSIAHRTIKLSG